MKRKIAILLATTMTLSAVPAFAARTKAPALLGSTTTAINNRQINSNGAPSSLNTIEDKQAFVTAYQNYLKTREATLKINVEAGSGADITKGTSMVVRLTNGVFETDKQDDEAYRYENIIYTADGQVVYYFVSNGKLYSQEVTRADGTWKLTGTAQEVTASSITQLIEGINNSILSNSSIQTFGKAFTDSDTVLTEAVIEFTGLESATDLKDKEVTEYFEVDSSTSDYTLVEAKVIDSKINSSSTYDLTIAFKIIKNSTVNGGAAILNLSSVSSNPLTLTSGGSSFSLQNVSIEEIKAEIFGNEVYGVVNQEVSESITITLTNGTFENVNDSDVTDWLIGDDFSLRLSGAAGPINDNTINLELFGRANSDTTDNLKLVIPKNFIKSSTGDNYSKDDITLEIPCSIVEPKTYSNVVAALPYLPYTISFQDETTATVEFLVSISDNEISAGNHKFPITYTDGAASTTGANEGYLAIPLSAVKVNGSEEVKATVDTFSDSRITTGTVTLAKIVNSGSTYIDTSYLEKKTFGDSLAAGANRIIIKESVAGSLNGETGTIRLSSDFKFSNIDGFDIVDANTNTSLLAEKTLTTSNRITFKLDTTKVNSAVRSAIQVKLPEIVPTDDSKYDKVVEMTISGAGISEETVILGERKDFGYTLKALTEVPTIVKGRYYALSETSESKNTSAEFELAETVVNSILSGRAIDFTVPSGVKIVDAKIVSSSNLKGKDNSTFNENCFDLKNDGTTLRLTANSYTADPSTISKLSLSLKLSIDAAYTGENVTLTVSGGGLNTTSELVIAKVADPFTITASSKNINLGYQEYSAGDIVISETAAGMFIEDGIIKVNVTAPYGTSELGISDATVAVTGGNLQIESVRGSNATSYIATENGNSYIGIKIKGQSTSSPATITISNVKIGTTRSVPYGAYGLEISGSAIINNNQDATLINDKNAVIFDNVKVDDLGLKDSNGSISLDSTKKENILKRYAFSTDSYKVSNYVNVITETGTFDTEVKVTIGSTTAIVDGKEVVMDVAPYIQASSNSTMIPLRFVGVALAGGDASSVDAADTSDRISWDNNSKVATIYYGSSAQKVIQFTAGSPYMSINGVQVLMDNGVVAELQNGRMFVPFRALGQALGIDVSWDDTTRTAIYNQQ